MALTTDPNEMDAPCMCDCGTWFDQMDGYDSKRKKHLICPQCGEFEEQDEEQEEEIKNYTEQLNEAVWSVNDAIKELANRGVKFTITVENNIITSKQNY